MLSIEVLLKLKLLYKYNLLHLDFSSNYYYYYNIRSSILVGVQNPRSIKVYSFRKKKNKK